MKRIHWMLFAVIVVCPSPSVLWAQWPGQINPRPGQPALPPFNRGIGAPGQMNVPPGVGFPPPGVPNIPGFEKRQDDQNPWINPHILGHLVPHGGHYPGAPNASGRGANLQTPPTMPAEVRLPIAELRNFPASELTITPPKFSPVVSEGGMGMARGFSRWGGGGILAGIGGALAGALGGIFGRKKQS
jgi:hypothetical protein